MSRTEDSAIDPNAFDPDEVLAAIRARGLGGARRGHGSLADQDPMSLADDGLGSRADDGLGSLEDDGLGSLEDDGLGSLEDEAGASRADRGLVSLADDGLGSLEDEAGASRADDGPMSLAAEAHATEVAELELVDGSAIELLTEPGTESFETLPPERVHDTLRPGELGALAHPAPTADETEGEGFPVGGDELSGIGAALVTIDPGDPRRETLEDPRIPDSKQFFKIGEVARITGVKPYVLRYWETEFAWIRPTKTSARQRLYRRQDVALILEIKRLRHEEGHTIAQAKDLIRARRTQDRRRPSRRPAASQVPSRIAEALAGATVVEPSTLESSLSPAPDDGRTRLWTQALAGLDRLAALGAETWPPLYVPEVRPKAKAGPHSARAR